jgi:hypothetical protein
VNSVPQQQRRDIYVNLEQKRKERENKKESVKCGLEDVTSIHVLSGSSEIKQIAPRYCSLFLFSSLQGGRSIKENSQ